MKGFRRKPGPLRRWWGRWFRNTGASYNGSIILGLQPRDLGSIPSASTTSQSATVSHTSAERSGAMRTITTARWPIKAWIDGVEFDDNARAQVERVASLPFIHEHVAIMPDVHAGIGATVGSEIPTLGAIVPSAVGVDVGCGVVAQRTTLRAEQLPDDLKRLRATIERAIPVGFRDHQEPLAEAERVWAERLGARFNKISDETKGLDPRKALKQLGSLGSGNHYISLNLDAGGFVWLMLHSGSRGVGNRLGSAYIERAHKELARTGVKPPDKNLAWFAEGTPSFDAYVRAVEWAQDYARLNRDLMLARAFEALRAPQIGLPRFELSDSAVNCHHNYVARERHYGADVYVTRKGAVRAGRGELGIIPGAMGGRSYVVRGKGNPESFESC